jgi:hypothetical protein
MHVVILTYLIKVIHSVFLWFAFYVGEKVALDDFITAVYVERKSPPRLQNIVVRVFIADFIFCVVLLGALYAVLAQTNGGEPLVGGWKLFTSVVLDTFLTWKLSLVASCVVAIVAQRGTCCRYVDDGLRGTRAVFQLGVLLSLMLNAVPYFLIL